MTVSLEERLLDFEACFNFRDLGGYPSRDGRRLRWTKLYRADSLHRFTPSDLVRFEALDAERVIDLRARQEIDDFGRLSPDVTGVDWVHRPIIESLDLSPGARRPPAGEEGTASLPGESYFVFLGSGEMVASVLTLIADSTGPVVFHCTSGKDRTGMIAAMILDLLGVADATIAADYVMTQGTRSRSMAWIARHEPEFAAYLAEIPPERRAIRPEQILGFLERVRAEYGSVEALALERGLPMNRLERLRDRLLE